MSKKMFRTVEIRKCRKQDVQLSGRRTRAVGNENATTAIGRKPKRLGVKTVFFVSSSRRLLPVRIYASPTLLWD
jgi:hypothetical protein